MKSFVITGRQFWKSFNPLVVLFVRHEACYSRFDSFIVLSASEALTIFVIFE